MKIEAGAPFSICFASIRAGGEGVDDLALAGGFIGLADILGGVLQAGGGKDREIVGGGRRRDQGGSKQAAQQRSHGLSQAGFHLRVSSREPRYI